MLDLKPPPAPADERDPLTGLLNRTGLTAKLTRHLEGGRGGAVAVLFIDVDDFSMITTSWGHQAGDHLLIELSQRLSSRLGPDDWFGRFQGDQFAAIVPGVDTEEKARVIAKRLQDALVETIYLTHASFSVRVSIGVTVCTNPRADAAGLLRDAGGALQQAKRIGKGQISFYDEALRRDRTRRLELAADLSQAIDAGQFELDFQAVRDMGTQNVVGAEAFVRWNHPRLGRLSPVEFVSVAIDGGLMNKLGAWIVDTACEAAASLRTYAKYDITVAVNFTSHELAAPGLPERIAKALKRHDLPPTSLSVEITEMELQDAEAAQVNLQEIAAMGVAITLDDFGTATSSISYLTKVRCSTLKLAPGFTQGIIDDDATKTIVEAIVGLAEKLGMQVVAGHVETDEQLAALTAVGVNSGQGYLLGKPASLAELVANTEPAP